MGVFDRSIFVRLKWLVLVHLRYVSLVILVLYASFVCFQDHRTCLTKGCIVEHFGAFWSTIGLRMDSLCLEPKCWMKLKALYALEDTKQWP